MASQFYTFLLAFCTSCFVFSSHHRHLSLISCALLLLGTWMLMNSKSNSAHKVRDASKLNRNDSSISKAAENDHTKVRIQIKGKPNPKLGRSRSLITVPRQTSQLELDVQFREVRPLQQSQNDRIKERAAVSLMPAASKPGASLGREPSLSAEEVKKLADAFIKRIQEERRLQRQDSYEASQRENIRRQNSSQRYKEMLDRSAG